MSLNVWAGRSAVSSGSSVIVILFINGRSDGSRIASSEKEAIVTLRSRSAVAMR
jgi:hypothetical protein